MELAEAEAVLPEVVSRVRTLHERVTITIDGAPAAVLIAPADLEALEETIEILSDSAAMSQLAESDAELARGEVVDGEDLAAEMVNRRR
ncbi:type II toxin-antitoxin system Phd/YefM family antitoxin [Nocardia higoensis]|uniref:Antitoxin n=1 Tax=Nocardia higoensis TaxID=228599 RepID=A0ABS0DF79_9NOCA|nr:type II toxin-antitoxin system prevent-host-death family antitoxin [Nocardia higoensis]MBF6357130.1 type II toxin-antitoxin system Phd/YefM family antitoxin [Nocardia higoensis]